MKIVKGRSLINGVKLGEVSINLIQSGVPPIVANFALVREDGENAGKVTKMLDWSETTMALLGQLQASMELDMADALFELTPGDRGEPENEETPQV